jgi:hypothetical protein
MCAVITAFLNSSPNTKKEQENSVLRPQQVLVGMIETNIRGTVSTIDPPYLAGAFAIPRCNRAPGCFKISKYNYAPEVILVSL